MSGLADLLPGPKQVEIDGKNFEVRAINLMEFASLLARFPSLNKLLAGTVVNFADFFKAGSEPIGAMIAIGCDHPEWESDAAKLPAHYQVKLLSAILPLTMPLGAGPFVADLAEMMATLSPPTPEQLRDKALAKVMRKQSQLSSNAGAAPTKPSGNSRPDSSSPTAT
jgi:hypothetical protein